MAKAKLKESRPPIPIWMTDPDYPAPCLCGYPPMPGDQMVLVEGETGLKRLIHVQCMRSVMLDDDDG